MMRIAIALGLVGLSFAGAPAGTYEIDIPLADVGQIAYSGRTLCAFTVSLPDDITRESFLSASLDLRIVPGEAEENPEVEFQIAEWDGYAVVLPPRKERPLSMLSSSQEETRIYFDLSPLLQHALEREAREVTVVAGRITDDTIGEASTAPIDGEAGIWGRLAIRYW